MPFLVRLDTREFLREEHLNIIGKLAVRENVYYLWDEATNAMVQAPGTGLAEKPVGRDRRRFETLDLGAIRPALEGRWKVRTLDGEVEVTTVFELLKQRAAAHRPEAMAEVTGVSAAVIRKTARMFANGQAGDDLHRVFGLQMAARRPAAAGHAADAVPDRQRGQRGRRHPVWQRAEGPRHRRLCHRGHRSGAAHDLQHDVGLRPRRT